ncbi:MAG: NUDIX domain-containing protein [bacterium]|nr:NUDIX domain-containing protein [bacterium]
MARNFNVRVYGVLIQNGAVLVSDEYIKKNKITKLPGGGLEIGEGTRDCLKREFKEELEVEVEVGEHFYTTDFYVASSFDSNSQVISIYYLVSAADGVQFKTSLQPHDYQPKEGAQSMRWIPLEHLRETDFTLIIDRRVGELILKQFVV